jgi:hypothetical protein
LVQIFPSRAVPEHLETLTDLHTYLLPPSFDIQNRLHFWQLLLSVSHFGQTKASNRQLQNFVLLSFLDGLGGFLGPSLAREEVKSQKRNCFGIPVWVSDTKALASEIKVELPFSASRTDEDIARAAAHHLEWNYSVPDTVKVQVTDGRVTLVGTSGWQYQKEEAERAVRSLLGVNG